MQLKKVIKLSQVAGIAILTYNTLYAENYIAIEYLQYDENDNRVSVQAPFLSASYDIGTDFTLKGDVVYDSVSGATPSWKLNSNQQFIYENQIFNEGRTAGSLMLTSRFKNRDELNLGIDRSQESDFYSTTVSSEYMHYLSSNHNQSINIGLSYSANEILSYNADKSIKGTDTLIPQQITPKNTDSSSGASSRKVSNPLLKDNNNNNFDTTSGASQKETADSLNVALGFTQILNQNSALKIGAFSILDQGYLTNPHATIIRNIDVRNILEIESRPNKRVAFGGTLNYITMLTQSMSIKLDYRFYDDDWDIRSHTIESGLYYQLNQSLTFGAGVRYYTQTEASFYNLSQYFFTNEEDASSDQRLSAFDAFRYNASIEWKQNKHFSYNLSGKFYTQSTGLDATIFTTGVKYRF